MFSFPVNVYRRCNKYCSHPPTQKNVYECGCRSSVINFLTTASTEIAVLLTSAHVIYILTFYNLLYEQPEKLIIIGGESR